MNIFIGLDLITHGINPFAWEAAYQESLCLISAFEFMDRIVDRTAVSDFDWIYATRTKERRLKRQKDGWKICGDLKTMQFSDSFSMYNSIEMYRTFGDCQKDSRPDIYTEFAHKTSQWKISTQRIPVKSARIFNGRTNGYPHHVFLLAIALLIENRFPGRAIVYGDITNDQLSSALQWASSVLGKKLKMPDRSAAQTLIPRLKAFYNHPQDLLNAFFTLSLEKANTGQKDTILSTVTEEDVITWFALRLSECKIDSARFRHYAHDYLQMGFNVSGLRKAITHKSRNIDEVDSVLQAVREKMSGHLNQIGSQLTSVPEPARSCMAHKEFNHEEIDTPDKLILWRPGMIFSSALSKQLEEFVQLIRKKQKTARCKDLFFDGYYPAQKQKILIELNPGFILLDTAWNKIFENLYNHKYIAVISALMLVDANAPIVGKIASAVLNNNELLQSLFMSDEKYISVNQ